MTLKQVFIHNLKTLRKKERLSQVKFAEYCNTSSGYISEIEIGRKFPSTEMIERIAEVLKVEPYHLFRDWTKGDNETDNEKFYPFLPNAMKTEIKSQIELSISKIFDKY